MRQSNVVNPYYAAKKRHIADIESQQRQDVEMVDQCISSMVPKMIPNNYKELMVSPIRGTQHNGEPRVCQNDVVPDCFHGKEYLYLSNDQNRGNSYAFNPINNGPCPTPDTAQGKHGGNATEFVKKQGDKDNVSASIGSVENNQMNLPGSESSRPVQAWNIQPVTESADWSVEVS